VNVAAVVELNEGHSIDVSSLAVEAMPRLRGSHSYNSVRRDHPGSAFRRKILAPPPPPPTPPAGSKSGIASYNCIVRQRGPGF